MKFYIFIFLIIKDGLKSLSNNSNVATNAATNAITTAVSLSENKNKKTNSTGGIKFSESKKTQNQQHKNSSYTSTASKEEDYSHSTSYEDSHSDYDSSLKKKKSPPLLSAASSRINFTSSKKVKSHSIITKEPKSTPSANLNDNAQQQTTLLPRPETLAVISHEVFNEKLVSSLSRQPSPVSQSKKIEETMPAPVPPPEPVPPSPPFVQAEEKAQNEVATKEATIPFIDEEFDELSYVLHRRQFGDKENKVPIKEETIFIKSSLRNSFMQKFATPLRRSFTRKTSLKSISKHDSSNNNTNINNLKFKLEIVSNEKRAQQIEASKINNDSTTTATVAAAAAAAPNAMNNQSITLLKSNIIPVPNSSSLTNSSSSQTPKISNNNPVLEKQASRQMSNPPPLPAPTQSFTNNVNNYKNKGKSENRARKALRTISFILGAFIFCFAPWHVVVIVNSFCTNCWQSTIYHHFYYSCYFLCYMNSPINPFMYALANQQFSKTFFRILKGDLRRL
jgi:hypothetical protein